MGQIQLRHREKTECIWNGEISAMWGKIGRMIEKER